MGSEVQVEHYIPGYRSTRELGEEASSHVWNYYDSKPRGTSIDLDSECDKDELKQKMLEHDAMFRRQVSELHRLYRTQKDLMGEMKRSEFYNHHRPLSINPLPYQREDSSKHLSYLPYSNSACNSPSIVGAEHRSPNFSHLKRKASKTNLLSAVDLDGSEDCEIIECRPGKVRKNMFDLQLSAAAYIDPNDLDQSIDVKPQISRHYRNGQSFLGGTSRSTSKGSGLKDFNEPVQIDDDPPTLDFLKSGTSRNDLYTKSFNMQTPPTIYSRETSFHSCYRGDYIDPRTQQLVYRETNRAHASRQLSLGQLNTKTSSLSQYLQPESSQRLSQFMLGKYGTPNGTSNHVLPSQSKEIFWKDRVVYSSKFADVGHETRVQGLNHPSYVKCRPPPMTSWEKYGCNSSKKQPHLISSAGLSKSSQASNQPSKVFGERLDLNSGHVVGIPRIKKVDHGSSSGSKEESICYPSAKFGNIDSSKGGAALKFPKGLNGFDLNCCDGIDSSAVVANDSQSETALHQNPFVADNMEQSKNVSLLPWMKAKLFSSDTARENLSQTSNQFLYKTASPDHALYLTKSTDDHENKKNRGYSVFTRPLTPGSFRVSRGHKSEMKRNPQVFDMNMPCDIEEANMDVVAADEIADKKVTGFKNFFDLNSCVTEDEASPYSASSVVRNIIGIDLEAPAPHETGEDIVFPVTQRTPQEAELDCIAAAAMVLFSSLENCNMIEKAEETATETLKWFVGIVSSCSSDYEQQNEEPIARASSEETDYFEKMTLNLTERTAEESMPKSAFPTIPNIEEETVYAIVSARPRRGQARRGRPKRDFQRDILPNLTSLSRHEVTEDLQALDGLMRSSGHAWQFGKRATARNKPQRGRPRTFNIIPVPDPIPIYPPTKQPTNGCIVAGMEERSLTGWGKTTRRPRRQRCPAGNLQPVQLS